MLHGFMVIISKSESESETALVHAYEQSTGEDIAIADAPWVSLNGEAMAIATFVCWGATSELGIAHANEIKKHDLAHQTL